MLRECMFSGHNLWVLKPNDCNRGRGVQIFNKLEDIRKLIMENAIGQELIPLSKLPSQLSETTTASSATESQVVSPPKTVKSDSFII